MAKDSINKDAGTHHTDSPDALRLKKLHVALSASHQGTLEWNIETDEIYFDEMALSVLGYNKEKFSKTMKHAKWWIDQIHPDHQKKVRENIHHFLEGKFETYSDTFRIKTRRDEYIWITSHASILEKNDEGIPKIVIGIIKDISERKEQDSRIKNDERMFQLLVQSIKEVFWIMSPDRQKVFYMSPTYEKIWGRPVSDVYLNATTWIDAIHKEDKQNVIQFMQTSMSQLSSAKNTSEETPIFTCPDFRIVRPDGSIRWISARGYPVYNQNGEIESLTGLSEDITERKNFINALKISEMKFKSLWDNFNQGIFFLDITGKLIDVNEGLLKTSGYRKDELLSLEFKDYFPEETLEEGMNALKKLQTDGSTFFITKFKKKDGSIYWGRVTANATFWTGKKVFQGFLQDITEERKRDQLLIDLSKFPEQNKNPVMRIGNDGVLLYTNPATRQIEDLQWITIGEIVPDKIKNWVDKALEMRKALRTEINFGEKTFIVDIAPFENGKYVNIYATDITFQKNYEEQLEEHAQIIQEAHDAIVVADIDNFIVEYNPAAEKMYGIKQEEAIGSKIDLLFPKQNNNLFKDVISRELQRNQEYRTIAELSNKEGESILCHLAISLLKDEEGNKKGTIICAIDISEIRKAQQLLYRIIDLLPIRIFWKDKNLRYLGCNQAFAEDAGKKEIKDIIGLDDKALPWKAHAEEFHKDDLEILETRQSKTNIEEKKETHGGKTIWLSTKKVPLTDEHGKLIGIVGAYEDITKIKESEMQLQKLIDDLQEYKDLTIDREHKMIQLKKQINLMAQELNKNAPYDLSFLKDEE